MDLTTLGDLYTTNFSLCYSPDGRHLAVADCYGRIFIFSLGHLLRADVTTSKISGWSFKFRPKPCAIYTLVTKCEYLICGLSDGFVLGYLWADVVKQNIHASFSFQADSCSAEINTILVPDEDYSCDLITAGGDRKIHLWDIENKKEKGQFVGHDDYIHALCWGPRNTLLISGSEDGTARFWDARAGQQAVHVLKPYTSECSRSTRGKWIGALASNGDFLVCGGGPRLGLWHTGSYSLVKPLDSEDIDHHCVTFCDDKIVACGNVSEIYHWNPSGEFVNNVPISTTRPYDIQFNAASKKYPILCVCGDGPDINVFLNLGYSSFVLATSSINDSG